MSLETAAKHLASKGRGPDTQLVHMSLGELNSLQELAKAHGGTLSINPNTGLPEAGFLSSILPMVIGAGLTAATGGALSPMMLGLGVGGVQALRTGDLGKGLMAGLGAYGGAGLAGGLMGAGAGAIDATQAALGAPNVAIGQGSQAAMLAAQNEGFGQAGLQALGESAGYAKNAMPFVQTPMQSLTRGAQGLLEPAGRDAFMKSIGGGTGLAKVGLAAAAPALLAEPKTEMPKIDSEQVRFSYNPGRVPDPMAGYPADYHGEYEYFRPSYTRLAGGGPVEAMSDANAVGANTGYPMANISRGAYATPYQQPISQNVVTGSQDTRVDALTGAERFADGGDTDGYRYEYDPVRQVYKQSLPPTTAAGVKSTSSGDMRGDGGGSGMVSNTAGGFGYGMGDGGVGLIGLGQSLSGMGLNSLGNAIGNMGISQLGAAEAAAAAAGIGYGMGYSGLSDASVGLGERGAIDAANTGWGADGTDGLGGGVDAGASSGTDYGSSGFGDYAAGGITGSGELNLNIPLDFGGGAVGGFGQGPNGAGLNINQGPLDLGQRNTGFGQAGVNGYTAAGSGAGSGTSITGQPLNSSVAAPFGITTQPQNPFNPVSDETSQRMLQMARDRGNVDLRPRAADLERNTARDLSFDEFKRMSGPRHPGDRVPTEAGYQDMYAKYLQDQTNKRAELGGLRQEIASQNQQNTLFDRLREMQAAGAGDGAPFAHVLKPGTSAYEKARMDRIAGVGGGVAELLADGGITALAYGGQSHLGDYSDGGRLLRGPGDGVSDSIPATIGDKRPARLADGEFVVPARIVSELGNGSTEAGARKLYAMMNRVQAARGKTTGKGKVAKNTRAEKYLPA